MENFVKEILEFFPNREALMKEEKRIVNKELLKDISTYAQGLKDVSKFIVVDPKELMSPIKATHSDLYNYLDERYWQ